MNSQRPIYTPILPANPKNAPNRVQMLPYHPHRDTYHSTSRPLVRPVAILLPTGQQVLTYVPHPAMTKAKTSNAEASLEMLSNYQERVAVTHGPRPNSGLFASSDSSSTITDDADILSAVHHFAARKQAGSGALSAVKRANQKRRLKQKSPFLSALSYDIAQQKLVGRSLFSSATRQSVYDSLCKILDTRQESTVPTCVKRLRRRLDLLTRKEQLGLRSLDLDTWITKGWKEQVMSICKNDFNVWLREDFEWANKIIEDTQVTILDESKMLRVRQDQQLAALPKLNDAVIWKDYHSTPPMKVILDAVSTSRRLNVNDRSLRPNCIEYCVFNKTHVDQVNELLSRQIYPGIDVSTEFGEGRFGIVASFGKKVVGCCFIDTSNQIRAYLMYLAVESGWQRAGIGCQLLYFALQKYPTRDFQLHCQATNWKAMSVYASLGFKPEGFIVGFYDKYIPWKIGHAPGEWNTSGCRNAFLMRRRH